MLASEGPRGWGTAEELHEADTVSGLAAPLLWEEAFGVSEFPSMAAFPS